MTAMDPSVNSTTGLICQADETPTKLASVVASVLMTIFLVVGVFGNAWTLWVLFRCTRLRQNLINNLIMSLCANDIINLTFIQSFVLATYYCHPCVLGTIACYFVPEANMLLVGSSLWHHAFIAIHRYLVVVQWKFYTRINKRLYMLVVILGSRAFPIILTVVFNSISYVKFQGLEQVTGSNELRIEEFLRSFIFYSPYLLRCVYKGTEKDRIICVLVLTVIQPCIIVLGCFTAIFIHVRRNGLLMSRKIGGIKEPPAARSFGNIQLRLNSIESLSIDNSMAAGPLNFSERIMNHLEGSSSGIETESISKGSPLPGGQAVRSISADPFPGPLKVSRLRRRKSIKGFTVHSIDKKRISRELAVTKMFGVVFLLFIAGYIPYGFVRMIDRTGIDPSDCGKYLLNSSRASGNTGQFSTPPDVYVFLSVLYAIASCCNPLIFGVMHRDIRKNAIYCFRTP